MAIDEFDDKNVVIPNHVESRLVPGPEPTDEECLGKAPRAQPLPGPSKPPSPSDFPEDDLDDGGWLCI